MHLSGALVRHGLQAERRPYRTFTVAAHAEPFRTSTIEILQNHAVAAAFAGY